LGSQERRESVWGVRNGGRVFWGVRNGGRVFGESGKEGERLGSQEWRESVWGVRKGGRGRGRGGGGRRGEGEGEEGGAGEGGGGNVFKKPQTTSSRVCMDSGSIICTANAKRKLADNFRNHVI
jgi:hypothetical protein